MKSQNDLTRTERKASIKDLKLKGESNGKKRCKLKIKAKVET